MGTSEDPTVMSCIHKNVISESKPSRTDQYGHQRKRTYRNEKCWQSVISKEIRLAPVGRCLLVCTGGWCCAALQINLLLLQARGSCWGCFNPSPQPLHHDCCCPQLKSRCITGLAASLEESTSIPRRWYECVKHSSESKTADS